MTVAGTGIEGYNGDGIPATEAMIQYPYGIFVTEQDELYICDYENYREETKTDDGLSSCACVAG